MPLAKFDFLNTALNPFILMFVAIITGLLFGKIKFGKFSFGSSGALFSGLAIGWAAYRIAEKIYAGQDGAAAGMKAAAQIMNRPLSSRQVKKEKLRHEGLVPVSKGSQTL